MPFGLRGLTRRRGGRGGRPSDLAAADGGSELPRVGVGKTRIKALGLAGTNPRQFAPGFAGPPGPNASAPLRVFYEAAARRQVKACPVLACAFRRQSIIPNHQGLWECGNPSADFHRWWAAVCRGPPPGISIGRSSRRGHPGRPFAPGEMGQPSIRAGRGRVAVAAHEVMRNCRGRALSLRRCSRTTTTRTVLGPLPVGSASQAPPVSTISPPGPARSGGRETRSRRARAQTRCDRGAAPTRPQPPAGRGGPRGRGPIGVTSPHSRLSRAR